MPVEETTRGIVTIYKQAAALCLPGSRDVTPSKQTGGQRLLCVYCPGHVGVAVNGRADRLAGKDLCVSTVLDMLESR